MQMIMQRTTCLAVLASLILAGCGDQKVEIEFNSVQCSPEEARARLSEATAITLPNDANILSVTNTHGGFLGDGQFAVIAQLDKDAFASLLTQPAPWVTNWSKGPVDARAGGNCTFGKTQDPFIVGLPSDGSPAVYASGPPNLIALYQRTDILWAARSRGPTNMPWHNGDLIILDPESKQVWYSDWDM